MVNLLPSGIDLSTVEIWQQDESRVGQQGSLTRIWAKKGTRPRKIRQQQFLSTHLYGATCSKAGKSFCLVLPYTDTGSMQIFLDEFSKVIDKRKHVALVIDNAGWHIANDLKVPANITLVPLPPYSPELNPMECVWRWIKDRYLSNRCYKNYDDIVEQAVYGWSEFSKRTETVKSLCFRSWMCLP